jgi:hypothetical protein
MAGLVPAVQVLFGGRFDTVDARDKRTGMTRLNV